LERLPLGTFRATFLLPTDRPDTTHHIEAEAASSAAAALLALNKAEEWAAGK
jgi:hypothetical protein